MLLKNKYDELKTFLSGNNILSEEEECYCYAEDASNLIKPEKTPDVVVFVETIKDVQAVMEYAYKNEIPIIPRGAGTNMVGACVSSQGGIVLNFSKMNKIQNIDSINMTATVQPGAVLGNIKKAAEKEGLFFPPDPSNYEVSTIGGAIAQSSGGALGFKYGTTKDYVLSLKVVTADGKLITLGAQTSKDSTGYHLAQLMVGSEGTLAIIVEATLKLIPKPQAKEALSAYFDSLEDGINAVNKIIESRIFPAAIDFMDKNALITVEDYTHCGLNTSKNCMLLLTADGSEKDIINQIDSIKNILENNGASEIKVSQNIDEYDSIWNARRTSFAASARLAPDVVTDDIIVPRNNLAHMVNFCQFVAQKYNLKMCMVGHAGDGNIHPQIALNLDSEEEYRNCMDARAEMYQKALELGGTISAEHGIGSEKKIYLKNTVDKEAIEYMKIIKKIFDPKNILNPDKIFS